MDKMNKKQGEIKHVAIYLRKSRDDGEHEDVLFKHRDTLLAMAKNHNWSYRLYEEIGSGESINKRKKMQDLLKHVGDSLYDGVLVMDIDRLGRGNHADWATICKSFLCTDTYVITPQKIYDLSQEQDEMMFDFQAIFAKMEYKMIKKRLRQGKIAGAKKGMWTNGSPPYPYVYNRTTKQLDVDPEKLKIYRSIVDKYISGMSSQGIAIWLNKNKIAPPYNSSRNKNGWSHVSVYRILVSEIHLGYVVYGKTQNIRGNLQLVKKDEWIKVKGEHTPVKTQAEHEQILAKIAKNSMFLKENRVRHREGLVPLSGLLYCSRCGRRMLFKQTKTKKGDSWSAICVYKYPDGTKCNQVGRKLDNDFYKALYQRIIKFDAQTLELAEEMNEQYQNLESVCQIKQKELLRLENSIEKLFDLYEDGRISKQRFSERFENHEKDKVELKSDIEQLKLAIAAQDNLVTLDVVKNRVNEFKSLWSKATSPSEQNKAFKLLIDRIVYDRVGEELTLEVLYR